MLHLVDEFPKSLAHIRLPSEVSESAEAKGEFCFLLLNQSDRRSQLHILPIVTSLMSAEDLHHDHTATEVNDGLGAPPINLGDPVSWVSGKIMFGCIDRGRSVARQHRHHDAAELIVRASLEKLVQEVHHRAVLHLGANVPRRRHAALNASQQPQTIPLPGE